MSVTKFKPENAGQTISSVVQTARLRGEQMLGIGTLPASEPSAALFGGIRWRLTLWYSSVLAVALLLAGVVLYLGVRESLLGPINHDLRQAAAASSGTWQDAAARFPSLPVGCPLDHVAGPLYVCYDAHGNVLGTSRFVQEYAPDLISPALARAALSSGSAEDTIQSDRIVGTAERYAVYAVPVSSANGAQTLGVVQIGASVTGQLDALDTLLHLLLFFGALTLLLSFVAGLFLANRALAPARLAHERQRDFIADASHELRTPLTMLRSNIDVVLRRRDLLPSDDVSLLEDTVQEAQHLTSLANSMLSLARLDAGEIRLEQDVVDLAELADEAARWAESLAADYGLRIEHETSGPVLVLGDKVLLEQAALILIDNAIKYNRPGGSVLVRVWRADGQANLEVRDTGIGVEASHLARLGERFYRVDKARSRESGGAGLGLSIVRSIADRHHGSFRLVSEPGAGTTATLCLPALAAREAAA